MRIVYPLLLLLSTNLSGQQTVNLALINSIDNSIKLEGLCFFDETYVFNDNVVETINNWHKETFPRFFQILDKQPEIFELVHRLDSISIKEEDSVHFKDDLEQWQVISGNDLYRYYANGHFDWERFNAESQCLGGFFQLSSLLITSDGRWMVLKMARHEGHLAADSWLVILELVNGSWKVEAKMLLWLS